MRAFVLGDQALSSQAGRFVWLELNTDLTANAAVLEKHEADALPTYLVVDPKDETVVLRWVGSFTVPQAETFLQEARDEMAGAAPPATPADAALARADHLYGARDYKGAAAAYREALATLPAPGPRYNRAIEALLFSFQQSDAPAEAIALVREALPRVGKTPSAIVVSLGGLDSALSLPKEDATRAATIAEMEAAVRVALADPAIRAAADDRSGAYLSLLQARKDAKDAEGAARVAAELAAFLEGEAAKATTPDARAVFDSHRMTAYLELGQPEKAVAMLEASAKDLPGDYNPPNRLVRAYAAQKRWDDALAASRKAAALATGRAKIRVLTTRASVMQEKGDKSAAVAAYDEAIAYALSLPEAERPAKQLEGLKKQRERLAAQS
jgi:tetratricopeptide (TPR) repeat protein